MAEFGELLAELRREKKMTQVQLGKILFVTASTISNYENGVRIPDIEKLQVIASFFDVSVDYLLGRTSIELSADVFDESIYCEISVGSFLKAFRELSIERKQAIVLIMHDMKVAMERVNIRKD